jgi:hypothetical protein
MFTHRRTTRLLVAHSLAMSLGLMTMAAEAGCRIFEHRDYGGAGYTLGNLDRMVMVRGESLGCTTNGHGGDCGSVYYEPSWNDKVSSFKVTAGCTLTLWQHVNESGGRFRSAQSYRYVGSRWNDQASEALCVCR